MFDFRCSPMSLVF